jgi:hypothetical protein
MIGGKLLAPAEKYKCGLYARSSRAPVKVVIYEYID